MFATLTKALVVATLVGTAAAAPTAVFAKGASPIGKAGTKIDMKDLCVRKKIQVCHWEGNAHICVWVDGPDCEIV